VVSSFSYSTSIAEQQVDAKALFEEKCSVCHELERPRSQKKTRAEWEVTLSWMKSMIDADISEKDAKIILDYLSENYGK
jgi:cytochrome c5